MTSLKITAGTLLPVLFLAVVFFFVAVCPAARGAASAPALGAGQEFCAGAACYTAHLPAQWLAEDSKLFGVTFSPPAPAANGGVQVLCEEYLLPQALLLAREQAAFFSAANTLRQLPGGQGFIFESGGERLWLMEYGGLLVRIKTGQAHKDLRAFLAGFTSGNGNLGAIFATLAASSAALDWLCYSNAAELGELLPPEKPGRAAMPDFSQYGAIEGERPGPRPRLQFVPEGWIHKTSGQWLVAASANGELWGAARLYPLAAAHKERPGGQLVEAALEAAAGLGGRNLIKTADGLLFSTPYGRAEFTPKGEAHALLCLYSNSDAEMWLMGFAE